jgi:hypothetical protein
MRCLEVAVNGEPYCVAGSPTLRMIAASVTYQSKDDSSDRKTTSLMVHGFSHDVWDDSYYWGSAETLALTAGDVVTIRVIDQVSADSRVVRLPSPGVVKLRELRKFGKLREGGRVVLYMIMGYAMIGYVVRWLSELIGSH